MHVDKTIQQFKSLPQEMQEAAMQYIQYLVDKAKTGINPKKPESDKPTIRWAKDPDPTALKGLSGKEPISLVDIRTKAWKR